MVIFMKGFNNTICVVDENGKILTAHDIEGVIKILKEKKKSLEKEFLEKEVRISHKLSDMSLDIEELKRGFNSLKENIIGRIIK